MEFFEAIGAFASVGSGGVLGVLGALGTRVFGYFERKAEQARQIELVKLDHDHELSLRDQDMAYMEREAELAQSAAQLELESKSMDASVESLQSTIEHDIAGIDHQGHTLLIVAEFIRKIYRPLLTTFLFGLVWVFYQDAPESAKAEIVAGVLALAACAGTWWFTDRTVQKGVAQNGGG